VGFGDADTTEFLDLQRVNALAPLLMAEAFVAQVALSQQKKIAAITSGLASITNVNDAASYAYRASKASLNMVMRKLAYDLKGRGILAAAISPGWVQTDMGGPDAALKVEDSAAGIIKVIGELDAGNTGGFFNYNGDVIPW
jgi:NAD(P)-dependent dehydrogenase (short-subunit alcohol dehydrogenase family)